ncbi:type II toxin-antitoxin system HicA family toxin [Bosea sp. (in: a-proteobacteria)]|uniref:type II toxin-antitoxin system HicA family toxin n=1 Tax=Bosea sp. (in: a-proteobacteria) TaxID=1871050 RepID=UPI003B3BCA66
MVEIGPRLKRILRKAGYRFHRPAKGDHEIWRHEETGRQVTLDAGTKSRHTANEVLKQAGLPKEF